MICFANNSSNSGYICQYTSIYYHFISSAFQYSFQNSAWPVTDSLGVMLCKNKRNDTAAFHDHATPFAFLYLFCCFSGFIYL